MTMLRAFWKDEQGQDSTEYTLLLAFVAMTTAALFYSGGNSIAGIWSVGNSRLAAGVPGN